MPAEHGAVARVRMERLSRACCVTRVARERDEQHADHRGGEHPADPRRGVPPPDLRVAHDEPGYAALRCAGMRVALVHPGAMGAAIGRLLLAIRALAATDGGAERA